MPKEEGGIGFRDLGGFSVALLARRLWSLAQRPETLAAKVLRAKYHKNSSILDASVGYRPSFIWRSLMGVQEFLMSRLRWRIGDGTGVRIWGDRWIPGVPHNYVDTAPRGLEVDASVCGLINPDTNQWDRTIVESCFTTTTA
ncbi:unnamed protein product [Linum trigynum]|uniref:Uncharacterized protein n=1 Tax=Linum trigynum TaxID=586398 RepID=A0AAV2CWH7_9ROSI